LFWELDLRTYVFVFLERESVFNFALFSGGASYEQT